MSHECLVCSSDDTLELTGEEVDFMDRLTWMDEDKEYGWTYLYCHDCGSTSNWWYDVIVSWDLSQLNYLLRGIAKPGNCLPQRKRHYFVYDIVQLEWGSYKRVFCKACGKRRIE